MMKYYIWLTMFFILSYASCRCQKSEDIYSITIYDAEGNKKDSCLLDIKNDSSCFSLKEFDYKRIVEIEHLWRGTIYIYKNDEVITYYKIVCLCESDIDILLSGVFFCDEKGRLMLRKDVLICTDKIQSSDGG